MTDERFLAFRFSTKIFAVPWAGDKISRLDCRLGGENRLVVIFDVADFHDDWTGRIEIGFTTSKAKTILEAIEELTAKRV